MTPMVPRKSSTLRSLSPVETFLKVSPAVFPLTATTGWTCAEARSPDAKPPSHTPAVPATARVHQSFMLSTSLRVRNHLGACLRNRNTLLGARSALLGRAPRRKLGAVA